MPDREDKKAKRVMRVYGVRIRPMYTMFVYVIRIPNRCTKQAHLVCRQMFVLVGSVRVPCVRVTHTFHVHLYCRHIGLYH